MSRRDNPASDRRPGALRQLSRTASAPWRRIGDNIAAIQRDFRRLRYSAHNTTGVGLDETGASNLGATAFVNGQMSATYEDALAARQGSTARNAWVFLALGVMFFLGWLYRLLTMTWSANATLTALQFMPACAVFFLLAFRFGLENYQIRMRRKVTAMEYVCAPSGFWPR
jgi:cation transport ATPase